MGVTLFHGHAVVSICSQGTSASKSEDCKLSFFTSPSRNTTYSWDTTRVQRSVLRIILPLVTVLHLPAFAHSTEAEQHLDGWLRQRIRGFDMEVFMKTVAEREGERLHPAVWHDHI